MEKQYREWTPLQPYLMPPSPQEWLPADHLAYFVLEVVSSLDLSGIERAIRAKDPRGERPYAPSMMVALLTYAYCIGAFSSRKISRGTYGDVAMRLLSAGEHPHFTTINQFRLEHGGTLAGLFVQVLQLCEKAGLVKVGHVAVDGTKLQANASKHKAMSYQRMEEEEKRLRKQVEALLREAERVDREEDELYGVGVSPGDLPEELKRRETRLEKIRQAKAELEREAAQARAERLKQLGQGQQDKAEDPAVEPAESSRARRRAQKSRQQARELEQRSGQQQLPLESEQELPHHHVAHTPEGKPAPKAQRNFTDADSRIMKRGDSFLQGYNAQVAVDGHSQVIVAQALTNQPADQQHLIAMIRRVECNVGRLPQVLTADGGYFTPENSRYCENLQLQAYIALGREHGRGNEVGRGPHENEAAQRMRRRLKSTQGAAIYRRRKAIVEPVFGQIREAQGFRRFLLRSLSKAREQWAMVCTAHNLLKLYRARGMAEAAI